MRNKSYKINHIIKLLHTPERKAVSTAFDLIFEAPELEGSTSELDDLYEQIRGYLKEETNSHIVDAILSLYRASDLQTFEPEVTKLSQSRDPKVRRAIASILGSFAKYDEKRDQSLASINIVRICIGLAQDKNQNVRDWATFQFANSIDNDSKDIRTVLKRNTKDIHRSTRQEAVAALAKRRDESVYSDILRRIKKVNVADVWVDAAASTKDAKFIQPLMDLLAKRKNSKKYRDYTSTVQEAITELNES